MLFTLKTNFSAGILAPHKWDMDSVDPDQKPKNAASDQVYTVSIRYNNFYKI